MTRSAMSVHLVKVRKWLLLLSVTFLYHVTDAQNRPPVCNQTYVSRSIVEGVPINTTVLDFTDFCSDPENGPMTYQLNDNANTQFIVPASTNLLKTNKAADAEAVLSYATTFYASPWTLRVTVRDNASSACVMTVFVTITSVNDNPAKMKNLAVPALREDTLVGTTVSGCTLVDGDYPGSGHDIPYVEIIAGNKENNFAIDYKTCAIMLVGPLDYEAQKSYTLTLRAYNFPSDSKASVKNVTVKVIDINDNTPTCSSYNIIMEITEDKVANDILLKLNCWDVDSLDGGTIEFFGDSPGKTPPLKVDQVTGEIILSSSLDFDGDPTNRNMKLVVTVTDKGTPKRSTKVIVAFRVIDVDDQPPKFTQNVFSASLPESANIGQLLLTVSAIDKDSPRTSLSKITYGYETPCTQDWFNIDSYTGAILVKNFLDWETQPVVTCVVYAFSSDKHADRSFANVTITLTDVNDRAPIFSKFLFEGSVMENAPAYTSILTLTASDPDEGVNGQFTYSLPNASPFAVDRDTGVVYVSATGIIDYESDMEFVLLVMATDKGTPSLVSQTYISINVEPVNEFTPVFNKMNDLRISELTKPGTLLATFATIDGDAGDDGKVEYYLQNSNVPFAFQPETGALWAGVGLDYESSQAYNLVVIAADKSQVIIKSSTVTLSIVVINENENDPVCDIVKPIQITLNTYKGQDPIGQLNCTDVDLYTTLRYDILEGDTYYQFNVDSSTGTIRLASGPREGTYMVVIGVSDEGTPVRITEVYVQINIETNLMFENLPVSISVYENASGTDLLYTVSAKGTYDIITYEIISGNIGGIFNLHKTKGDVKLVSKLDRETRDMHELEIRAATKSGQSVQSTITIIVQDINDNIPMFSSSFDYIRLLEELSVPSSVKQYAAIDWDIQENSQLDYSIISGDPGHVFACDSNGVLSLNSKLDFETQSFYTLVLGVSDRGNPSLNNSMIVFLEVIDDKNDNNVKIVPSGGTVSLSRPEDTAIGSALIKIDVQNNDSGSDLIFEITSGNSGNNFTVGSSTGVVYLSYALDREIAEFMNIGIRVSNVNGKTANTMLVINITDVNDNDPVFNPDNYIFLVPHGTMPGSTIGTLSVTDLDIGVNKDLTLSIISGDINRFSLSGKTLMAASIFDAYVQSYYMLIIQASDHGIPSRNSTASVTVIIQPELKKPMFVPKTNSTWVEETCAPGMLYNADATYNGATERSSTSEGDLVYSLSSGDSRTFYVEPDIGEVQLIAPLAYSPNTSYTLIITASNKKALPLSDTFTLTIIVTQVNRYAPVFSTDIYIWSVSETATVGTTIGRLIATDKDLGEYGLVTYTIKPNKYFKVNTTTGTVTLASPLEYSTMKSCNLFATATDNAGANSRTASTLVEINVIDENNHAPVFSDTPFIITVPENVQVGTVVEIISAEDLDSGLLGSVSYSVISGDPNGLFALNSTTGALSIGAILDFESGHQYILHVQGKDGGTPPLSDTVTVTVNVDDLNDNTPDFRTKRIDTTVKRNTSPMTPICNVLASDRDAGNNGAVHYVIQDGNNDHLFNIDAGKGIITAATSLSSANSFHTLTVLGIDQGNPSRTGTVTVGILVIPVQYPGSSDYEFTIKENEYVGTLVGSVPQDPALNSIKAYTISGGNYESAFDISTNANKEGVLRTNIVLDRETYAYYQLRVSVEYVTGTKEIYVTVIVLDDNDNAPVFDNPTLEVHVVENLAAGNTVGAVSVTDADGDGVNSQVDFSIVPPDSIAHAHFSVQPSGLIQVIKPISYETTSFVKCYVVARDRGTPQQSSTATVLISVVDVNEVSELTHNETAYYISREFPDDTREGTVCVVTAADVGFKPSPDDNIRFIIVGTESVFDVHSRTGAMQISRPSLIFGSTRYFQWIIVTLTSAGIATSRALLVRLDTFNKAQHLISLKINTDLADLVSKIDALRSQLQSFFQPPQAVRIWTTQSVTQQSRRRLLNTQSEALFVVVQDDAADDMTNVHMKKTFFTNDEAVKPLQASPDGTPVESLASSSPPVISVMPHQGNEDSNNDSIDPAFIALIAMGCIVGLVLVIGAISLIIYCISHRRTDKREDKSELVMEDDNEIRKVSSVTIWSTVSQDDSEIRRISHVTIRHPDMEHKQVPSNSSTVNTAHGNSLTDREHAANTSTRNEKALVHSQSISGSDSSSRKRKITPVNEPSVEQLGTLEMRSDQRSDHNLLNDLLSDGKFRATAIIVSSLNQSPSSAEPVPTRKISSTMLSSLEDDALDAHEDTSVA